MATVTVEVTQEDISRGVRDSCLLCPVALGVARTLPHLRTTDITGANVWLSREPYGEGEIATRLPIDAREWIARFDNGKPVAPFTFALGIPDDLLAPAEAPNV